MEAGAQELPGVLAPGPPPLGVHLAQDPADRSLGAPAARREGDVTRPSVAGICLDHDVAGPLQLGDLQGERLLADPGSLGELTGAATVVVAQVPQDVATVREREIGELRLAQPRIEVPLERVVRMPEEGDEGQRGRIGHGSWYPQMVNKLTITPMLGMMVNMLTTSQPRIGIIVGSTRPGSFNALLAQRAQELRPDSVRIITGIDRLPFFSEEHEEPAPQSVTALRAAVAEVDALVFVTPEYNASLPAVLKNAIDWISRPRGSALLDGLPVAVLGASPSPGGASSAIDDAVRILRRALAKPIEQTLSVPRASVALGSERLDDTLAERVGGLLDELAAAAAAVEVAA